MQLYVVSYCGNTKKLLVDDFKVIEINLDKIT